MFPLTDAQKVALADLQKRGIENRIAWVIISEGFLTFEEFCANRTAREMLRIPNFGDVTLRKVMTFAVRNSIDIRDDRLPAMMRKPAKAREALRKGPAFEFAMRDFPRETPLSTILTTLNLMGAEGWQFKGVMAQPRLGQRAFVFERKI